MRRLLPAFVAASFAIVGCVRHPSPAALLPGRIRDELDSKFVMDRDMNMVSRIELRFIAPSGKDTKTFAISDRDEIVRILNALASASHAIGGSPPTQNKIDFGIEISGGGPDEIGTGGLRSELVDRWGPEVTSAIEKYDPWPIAGFKP